MATPAESRMQYIRQHGIHVLLESVVSKLLEARPDKPLDFLINELHLRKHNGVRMNIGVFGLDNAGKTTLIGAMSGNPVVDPTPTVGFSFHEFVSDEMTTHVYDLGGGPNFRGVWPSYYGDIHGAIFVVDASNPSRFEEAASCLSALRGHYRASGKATLVVANKRDSPDFVPLQDIAEALALPMGALPGITPSAPDVRLVALSANQDPPDPAVDDGLGWLISRIRAHYVDLDHRVKWQTAEAKAHEREQRRLRAERVALEEAEAAAAKAAKEGGDGGDAQSA